LVRRRKMSEKKEITVVDVGVDISGFRIVSVSFRDTKRRLEWDEVCYMLRTHDDLIVELESAEQTLRNLAVDNLVGDSAEIARNAAANIQTAIERAEWRGG